MDFDPPTTTSHEAVIIMPGLLVEMGVLLIFFVFFFLLRQASNCYPLDLCLPSSWDYSCLLLHPTMSYFLNN
jgi:hypothetical protein